MTIFTAADLILGATTIRQVTQINHASGQTHRKAMTSGGAAVTQVSLKESIDVTTFTSADLAALLALNTNTFCSVGIPLIGSTITVPVKVRANGGTFASGSAHPAFTGSNALIVPTSFEVSNDSDAGLCTADIHWLSADGAAAAITDSTGNALGAQSFNAEFGMGPCYINGTLIAGAQSFRVNPGIEVVKPPAGSGLIRPTRASIKMGTPTMELTVNSWDAVASTLGTFVAMTSANFYMRKRADSAIYSASSDNIRFTFAAGLTDTNSISIANNDDGSATITLHGKVLTASAAVALP
jgi:hypothetical protein